MSVDDRVLLDMCDVLISAAKSNMDGDTQLRTLLVAEALKKHINDRVSLARRQAYQIAQEVLRATMDAQGTHSPEHYSLSQEEVAAIVDGVLGSQRNGA